MEESQPADGKEPAPSDGKGYEQKVSPASEGEEEQGKNQYDGNTYRKNAVGFDLMGIGDGNDGSAYDVDFYIRLRLAGFLGTVF